MKIYHNPRCRKSRETLALIQDQGIEPEIILYLKNVPTKTQLKKIVKMLGIRSSELIRKGEHIYKERYKDKDLSDDQWLDAMVAHPQLIERPIVVSDKKAILGRPPENVKALF